jgi:hypothetical protein
VHALVWHVEPVPHALPHPPQFVGSFVVFTSQPVPAFPSQFAKPGSHAMPHVFPSHVAVPFGGVGQGVHDVPHVCGFTLERQAWPHA